MRTIKNLVNVFAAILLFAASSPCFAAPVSIRFNGDTYFLVWAHKDGQVISNEYLRVGETVDKWNRMITVKQYTQSAALKDVLPSYLDYIQPMLALKPDFLVPNQKKHQDEVTMLLTLLAPDKSHYEYVVHHMYVDKDKPVMSVLFSLNIPYAKNVSFDVVMKSRNEWITEISGLEPPIYASVPDTTK